MSEKKTPRKTNSRWISTLSKWEWIDGELVEVYDEGYEYDGPLALAHNTFQLEVESYRWRYDDGDEANASWAAATNASHTVSLSGNGALMRLRVVVDEFGGVGDLVYPNLEFRVNGGTWQAVSIGTAVQGNATTAVSPFVGDGDSTTQQESAGHPDTFTPGIIEDGSYNASFTLPANNVTEVEFVVYFDQSQILETDVIDIRFVSANDVDLYTTEFATVQFVYGLISLTQADSGIFPANPMRTGDQVQLGDADVTPVVVGVDNHFLVRGLIQNGSGYAINVGLKLQRRINSGSWVDVLDDTDLLGNFQYVASEFETWELRVDSLADDGHNDALTESVLTGTGTWGGGWLQIYPDNNNYRFTLPPNGYVEVAARVVQTSLGGSSVDGDIIDFRWVRENGTALTAYTSIPSIELDEAPHNVNVTSWSVNSAGTNTIDWSGTTTNTTRAVSASGSVTNPASSGNNPFPMWFNSHEILQYRVNGGSWQALPELVETEPVHIVPSTGPIAISNNGGFTQFGTTGSSYSNGFEVMAAQIGGGATASIGFNNVRVDETQFSNGDLIEFRVTNTNLGYHAGTGDYQWPNGYPAIGVGSAPPPIRQDRIEIRANTAQSGIDYTHALGTSASPAIIKRQTPFVVRARLKHIGTGSASMTPTLYYRRNGGSWSSVNEPDAEVLSYTDAYEWASDAGYTAASDTHNATISATDTWGDNPSPMSPGRFYTSSVSKTPLSLDGTDYYADVAVRVQFPLNADVVYNDNDEFEFQFRFNNGSTFDEYGTDVAKVKFTTSTSTVTLDSEPQLPSWSGTTNNFDRLVDLTLWLRNTASNADSIGTLRALVFDTLQYRVNGGAWGGLNFYTGSENVSLVNATPTPLAQVSTPYWTGYEATQGAAANLDTGVSNVIIAQLAGQQETRFRFSVIIDETQFSQGDLIEFRINSGTAGIYTTIDYSNGYPAAGVGDSPVTATYEQTDCGIFSAQSESRAEEYGDAVTGVSLHRGTYFQFRAVIQETAGGSTRAFFAKLQYNLNSTGWSDVLNSGTAVLWGLASGSMDMEDPPLSDLLGTGTGTRINGFMQATTFESNQLALPANGYTEIAAALKFATSLVDTDVIQLRWVESDGTPLSGSYVLPTITIDSTAVADLSVDHYRLYANDAVPASATPLAALDTFYETGSSTGTFQFQMRVAVRDNEPASNPHMSAAGFNYLYFRVNGGSWTLMNGQPVAVVSHANLGTNSTETDSGLREAANGAGFADKHTAKQKLAATSAVSGTFFGEDEWEWVFVIDIDQDQYADGDKIEIRVLPAAHGIGGVVGTASIYPTIYINQQPLPQKDLTVEYSTEEIASDDLTTNYSLNERVLDNLALQYSLNELASDDLALQYNADGTVSDDLTVNYSLDEHVFDDLTTNYSLSEHVFDDVTTNWSLSEHIADNLTVQYDMSGPVFDDLTTPFDIVVPVSDDLTTQYSVLLTAQDDLSVEYTVTILATKDLSVEYSAQQLALDDLTTNWDAAGEAFNTLFMRYDVLVIAQDNLNTFWSTIAEISDDVTLQYNADGQVQDDLQVRYGIDGGAEKFLTVEYATRENVADDVQVIYTVANDAAISLTLNYSLDARVFDDFTAQFDLQQNASQTLDLAYYLDELVSRPYEFSYDLDENVAKDTTVEYGVAVHVFDDWSLVWTNAVNVNDDLTVQYSASEYIADELTVQYATEGRVSDDLTLPYGTAVHVFDDISVNYSADAPVFDDLGLPWDVAAHVSDDFKLEYAVSDGTFFPATGDRNLSFAVEARVDDDLNVIWSATALVFDDVTIPYDLLQLAQEDLGIEWATIAQIQQDLQLAYRMTGKVGRSQQFFWHLAVAVAAAAAIAWGINNLAADEVSIEWSGNEVVTDTLTIRLNRDGPAFQPLEFYLTPTERRYYDTPSELRAYHTPEEQRYYDSNR